MYRSDNIGSWISLRAERDPDRIALVYGAERLTYAELEERVAAVAGALVGSGIEPGDRVAVALKNRPEFIEMLFATARVGAIFVPLNFRLSSQEVAYAIRDSGSKLVVTSGATQEAVGAAIGELEGRPPELIGIDTADQSYARWRSEAEPVVRAAPVKPETPVSIVYTSGTTGPPKGAVLTHGGVLANVENYLADWDLRRDDVTVVVNPIFHVVLYILCVPLLYKGGTVVLMEDFDADEACRAAAREGVTVWFAIPTAWQMLLDSAEFAGVDIARIRFIGSGGAACPAPLMQRFDELGLPYRQGYGLSETTSSATTMAPEHQAGRFGSIGRPFFHVEARIVDERGRVAAPGEVGEIQLRGRNICAGYWNKPEETARCFDGEGWFSTGDIGRADEQGFLWIVDRKKDLIISGGENISSIEVEQAVVTHPDIAEVAVVGIPHERWGETPCAVVVSSGNVRLDRDELIEHCRARIARYKCPTEIVQILELPKTANGKVSKAQVRELIESELVS